MRTETITIRGTLEYEGEEYDYTVLLRDPSQDARPSEVTDLDGADGATVPDGVDMEALESLAMDHALLTEWCEQAGWEEEDSGGGCSALIQEKDGVVWRITRDRDPRAPQTLREPVAVGTYRAADDQPLNSECRIYPGGIEEMLASGKKDISGGRKEPGESTPVRIVVVVEEGILTSIYSDGACAVEAVYADCDPQSVEEERIVRREEVEIDPETVERHFRMLDEE